MRLTVFLTAAILMFSNLAVAQDQHPLQRDLMIITELLPGTYDNMEQFYFDRRLKLPDNERHQRVLTEARRIPNDRFGEHAFFVLDYWYEEDRWQPRVYSFHMDEGQNAIRTKIHFFNSFDPTPYFKAHEDLSLLDSLDLDDLTHVPGCDILWRPVVHGYQGSTEGKACLYERDNQTVYAHIQMMLDDRALWKGDVIRRLSDDVQVNKEPSILYKQNKARWFSCWLTFEHEGEDRGYYSIAMHDQGGEFFVDWPSEDNPDRQLGIRMRNVDWAMNAGPGIFTNDILVLYVVDRSGDRDENITYTWGAPEDTTVGLNLKWLLTSCKDTPMSEVRPYIKKPPVGPWQDTRGYE